MLNTVILVFGNKLQSKVRKLAGDLFLCQKKTRWEENNVHGQVDAILRFVLRNVTICTSSKYDWVLSTYTFPREGHGAVKS